MKRSLYRSRDSFAEISWALVKELRGDVVAAALFDWIAWKCESEFAPADDAGDRWYPVSYPSLAELTGISEKVIRTTITKLVDAGHVATAQLRLGGSYDQTRSYAPVWSEGVPCGADASALPGGVPSRADGTAPQGGSDLPHRADVPLIDDLSTTLERPSPADAVEVVRHDVDRLCQILRDAILANGVRKNRTAITSAWRDQARLLLDRDGVSLTEAIRVLQWSQADPFWRKNILSMPTFREKFDQLKLAAGGSKVGRTEKNLALVNQMREEERRAQVGGR